ncbi:hypothetical protein LTR36_004143 [Oleoguttula mirabilis]|uniref:ferric-chelate reductase (NADPH) n=1 Tax=Oleoguttula mirabilis TaxID=1507867 RepID=A0AAV9JI56_9PEZI|nr:hypothetical protein LTR36_004143 [Oleoguttula mirabilis]
MDMSGMDMSGGVDMASSGLFTPFNKAIARGYWYGIAGVAGFLTLVRTLSAVQNQRRLRLLRKEPHSVPSRPAGVVSRTYATALAACRELAYPQPWYFTGRISKYFSPLPIGRWLVLAVYWTVILLSLWSDTILRPSDQMYAYKWEKVGFRAAWVSVAQIPFIYLLSCKFNVFSLATGISYERLNWLHRWAARTVFLTAIVHWSFFVREWWLADFVQLEIQMMPMVKYGFGAFAVISWMVFSGFGFFRAMNYELFVAQHLCAAAVLLWLLFSHVPTYAQYNVWMSIGFVALDWGMRIVLGVLRNTHLLAGRFSHAPGYETDLECLPGDIVRLTIRNADFSWRPGQHAYLSMPRLRPFEMHPFTIANATHQSLDGGQRPLTMLIKAHSGFSKSLHQAASRGCSNSHVYRAFLSGPYGMPPNFLHYETVVLVACGSGASFTTPLLEEIVSKQGCVRQVTLHWIMRSEEHFEWFSERLTSLVEIARRSRMVLQVVVHVTRSAIHSSQVPPTGCVRSAKDDTLVVAVHPESDGGSTASSLAAVEDEKTPLSREQRNHRGHQHTSMVMARGSRPTVEAMVRPSVETALGETAVVVCGGLAITAQARTFVASFSNERAVHKGTGAQGIFLFTETYGW